MKYGMPLVIMGALFVAGCGPENQEKMTEKKLHVINVLDAHYHDDAHIKGSENVPFENFDSVAQEKLHKGEWRKDDIFVTYCANYQCTASCEAAKSLKKLGCASVRVYEGGMAEWISKGFAHEGPATEGYLSIVGEKSSVTCADIEEIDAESLKTLMMEHSVLS